MKQTVFLVELLTMQSKHLSLLKRGRKVPPSERKPLLMTELNEEEERQKAQ